MLSLKRKKKKYFLRTANRFKVLGGNIPMTFHPPVEPAPVEDLLPLPAVDPDQAGPGEPQEVVGEEEEGLRDPAHGQRHTVDGVREAEGARGAAQNLHALPHPHHCHGQVDGGTSTSLPYARLTYSRLRKSISDVS